MQVPVEFKKKYLERKIQELQSLRTALNENDYSQALILGHQVKGSAVTFDFPQMTQLGVAIEFAAKRQDKEKVQNVIGAMEIYIQDARHSLLMPHSGEKLPQTFR